jgi:hypothetical protein
MKKLPRAESTAFQAVVSSKCEAPLEPEESLQGYCDRRLT